MSGGTAPGVVHVVVPAGLDDPAQVSGGNRYDRRLCGGLQDLGWHVTEIAVPGSWPKPDRTAREALARSLDVLPLGSLVVLDGLIASAVADVLVPRSAALRLVVLVHMPLGGDAVPESEEEAVLSRARAVVTTSAWTKRHLLDRYPLPPARVTVARPGTDPGCPAGGTADGGRLLCVGALTPVKGQDLLVEALADVAPLPWRCTFVGSLDRDRRFLDAVQGRAAATGTTSRIRFTGPLTGADLRREYSQADVLLLPSRAETYGMVVTEALAAGLPVIATDVGGVPEALGRTAIGPPGLLVPPRDPAALAGALGSWLTDADLRSRLRAAARRRGTRLAGWPSTAARVASVLRAVRDEPGCPSAREHH